MINVLYQFNEKYAPYAGTAIASLFENNKKQRITVHILGEDLSSDSCRKFDELATKYGQEIILYETEAVIEKIKALGISSYRGSYAANLRMFIPNFIEKGIDRILYLDADTIVNGDISELFSLDLEDNIVGMIIDSLGDCHMREELNLPEGESYYNSGVIIYDFTKWKTERITEKITDYAKNNSVCFASPDQDLLNVVLQGRIKKLSPKYNFQPFHLVYSYDDFSKYYGADDYYSKGEVEEALRDVRIYHSFRYVGEFPWDKNTIHPYRDIFDKYLMASPWKDYEKKPTEATMVMKIEKILYKTMPKRWFLYLFSCMHKRYLNGKKETLEGTKN